MTGKEIRRWFLCWGIGFNKARKDMVARGAAQDTNIGAFREGHGGSKLAFVKDKEDLVIIVGRESAAMIMDLLAVVLRRE